MKPGIYLITNKAYHSGVGLSSSDLKELLKSPAHWKTYKENPIEPTPEMIRGTLVHAMLLEPETFTNDFAVGAFSIRRGKEYDKLVSENPEKTVISYAELEEATKIVDAFKEQVKNNETLTKLTQGVKENSIYWKDPTTGVLCKARPDIICSDGTIVDIKTARDASFDAFQKAIVDYQYFISAAYYLRAQLSLGIAFVPAPRFIFIVIETKEPYSVAIYELDQQAIEFGNQCINKAIETYADAVSTDTWSGYSKTIIEMGLPNYAFYKFSYIGGTK